MSPNLRPSFFAASVMTWMLALIVSGARVAAEDSSATGSDDYARQALAVLTESGQLHKGEHIVGMVGFYGQPLPAQWLILTNDPVQKNVYREFVVARGKVLAERKFSRLKNQDLPSVIITPGSIRTDALAAFHLAEEVARQQLASFDSMHFQLRCRDAGNEPVWTLNLIDKSQVAIGVIHISALSGKILHTQWMHPGKSESGDSLTQIP